MKIKYKTFNDFIEVAKKKNKNDIYFIENSFSSYDEPISAICKIHGIFQTTPHKVLNGYWCPSCGGTKKLTTKEFVEKAKKIHGDKYDYSKVNYVNYKTKVHIICQTHGAFTQTPHMHLSGQGCPECKRKKISEANKYKMLSAETFTQKANSVHNFKYKYPELEVFVNQSEKIKIICPLHGEFFQNTGDHLQGHGCKECGPSIAFATKIENNTTNTSMPEEDFKTALEELFSLVEQNYNKDPRYPFHCDFYIPERDLFIELNLHWTHGKHWFSKKDKDDVKTVATWLTKSNRGHKYYESASKTWVIRDKEKQETAKKNNLNYVALWNEQDIEDWFALGCPDGHDGDGMYTWKEKTKND